MFRTRLGIGLLRIYIFLIITLFATSSCNLTYKLWNEGYKDQIEDFITTRDGSEVAFIGEKYHYLISDNDGFIKSLLFWNRRNVLYVDTAETTLRVDQNNNVKAYISIKTFSTNLSFADQSYLRSRGFVRDEVGFAVKLELFGKRFIANQRPYNAMSLNRVYNLSVYYDKEIGALETFGKAALSPITFTIDSIKWVGEIIMIPLGN